MKSRRSLVAVVLLLLAAYALPLYRLAGDSRGGAEGTTPPPGS